MCYLCYWQAKKKKKKKKKKKGDNLFTAERSQIFAGFIHKFGSDYSVHTLDLIQVNKFV